MANTIVPALVWEREGSGVYRSGPYLIQRDHRPGVPFVRLRRCGVTISATFTTIKAAKLAAERDLAGEG